MHVSCGYKFMFERREEGEENCRFPDRFSVPSFFFSQFSSFFSSFFFSSSFRQLLNAYCCICQKCDVRNQRIDLPFAVRLGSKRSQTSEKKDQYATKITDKE